MHGDAHVLLACRVPPREAQCMQPDHARVELRHNGARAVTELESHHRLILPTCEHLTQQNRGHPHDRLATPPIRLEHKVDARAAIVGPRAADPIDLPVE